MRIKEQTSQRYMFQRDWTTSSNNNDYSTLDSDTQLGGPHVSSQEVNKHAPPVLITKSSLDDALEVHLLMQQKFHCVNLSG